MYLVGLDGRGQHVAHQQRFLADGHACAAEVIGDREDAGKIIRRVTARPPGIVEIEPADQAARAERRIDRIELVCGARHARAVGHNGTRHHWANQLHAFRIGEGLHRAAQCVEQAQTRVVIGFIAVDLFFDDVARDVDELAIGGRAQ